jgi:hypothetical protein
MDIKGHHLHGALLQHPRLPRFMNTFPVMKNFTRHNGKKPSQSENPSH